MIGRAGRLVSNSARAGENARAVHCEGRASKCFAWGAAQLRATEVWMRLARSPLAYMRRWPSSSAMLQPVSGRLRPPR